jgi:hypothetical protein
MVGPLPAAPRDRPEPVRADVRRSVRPRSAGGSRFAGLPGAVIEEVIVRKRTTASLAIVVALWLASPAEAQKAGVRAGVSGDPDQFFFGGHVETSPLVDQLSFRPNVEVGLGDNRTLVALNIEFVYGFPLRRQPWRVYVGGGPAANIVSFSDDRPDGSDVNGGFNLLVGLEHREGLFTELKVGMIDSPSIKFTVGYNFRR